MATNSPPDAGRLPDFNKYVNKLCAGQMKVYDFSETLKMSRVNSAEDPAVPKTFQLVDSVQLPLSLRTGRENVRFSQIVPQFNVIVLSTDV